MRSRGLKRHYLLASIIVICLFYIIPYTFLKKASGIELIAFWTGISLAWLAVTNTLLAGDLM